MGEALDYSYDRPDPNRIRDAGYEAVGRYLGHDARCLTIPERDRLHAAGLRIFLFCQTTIKRPLSGYAGGSSDADLYNWYADEMGWPKHMPLLYVTDVGRTEGTNVPFPQGIHHDSIRSYYQGIVDRTNQMGWGVNYRPVAMYGPYSIVELLRYMNLHCYMQTAGDGISVPGAPTGGWIINAGDNSNRKYSDLACMYQMYGIPGTHYMPNSIDFCKILRRPVESFAWHPADGQTGPPPPPEEDEDMPEIIIYAQSKPGSEMAQAAINTNADSHWFSISHGDYRHIGPDEKAYLDAILWSQAVAGIPQDKWTVRRFDDPQPDHFFTTTARFRGRP